MLAVGEAMNHVENIKSDAPIKMRAPMIARSFSRTKPRDSQEYKTKMGFQFEYFRSNAPYILLVIPPYYQFESQPSDDKPRHVFRVAIKNPYIC